MAYQEKTIAELNDVVVELHRQVDELRSRLDVTERTVAQRVRRATCRTSPRRTTDACGSCSNPSSRVAGFLGSNSGSASMPGHLGLHLLAHELQPTRLFRGELREPGLVARQHEDLGVGHLEGFVLRVLCRDRSRRKTRRTSCRRTPGTAPFMCGMTTACMNLPFCSGCMSAHFTSGGPTTFSSATGAASVAGVSGGGAVPPQAAARTSNNGSSKVRMRGSLQDLPRKSSTFCARLRARSGCAC